MRQAIGTTWVMQLVIIFMLIFVAFLALTINYTKAFKVKNELVTIVEKYEGIQTKSGGSIELINNYLSYNGYGTMKACETGYYGVDNLNDPTLKEVVKGQKYYYCIKPISSKSTSTPNREKYKIQIFFKFSLPVIGDIFTFAVEGTTIDITNPNSEI